MNTIDEKWRSFEAEVVPKNAPPVQRIEMRRAFYAGASGALRLMTDLSDLSEDAAVLALEGLHEEARQFTRRVGVDR
jgi:hypothetical protein